MIQNQSPPSGGRVSPWRARSIDLTVRQTGKLRPGMGKLLLKRNLVTITVTLG